MPIYDPTDEAGRIIIRLKALHYAQSDIETYGPIARDDKQLAARARHYIAEMERQKPTPEAILTDDIEEFTRLFTDLFTIIYQGLTVTYTGVQDPYKLKIEPRFTTSVNTTGSDDEEAFFGLAGLQAILVREQESRKKAAQEDGENPDSYLLTFLQVSIYDEAERSLEWYEQTTRCVLYDIRDTTILGVREKSEDVPDIDEILQGVGLPTVKTDASLQGETDAG